ncbi:unnamed protein product [Rotaria socialis]|uniref:G domain-containing protein n=1 Tax=Rotaria socialis TaxID=392032 RepID=A0A818MZR4_9BILA|nr:unnamed protein product [Rotaria socialis]CAF4669384.1 unnamed protein product [Rotaria socialis]
MAGRNHAASTITCPCGQSYNDQVTLDEHKKTSCQRRGFSCEFCNEYLPTSQAMGAHLYQCGNKTDQCPVCQKFVRRAVFTYHVYNNCIDLDEDYTSSKPSTREKNSSNRPFKRYEKTIHTSLPAWTFRGETQTGSNDEDLTDIIASIQKQESHSDSEPVNISPRQATKNKESAVLSLRAKTSEVHDRLQNDYYSSELDHVKEKLQFNIILIGSPRVGKSQLINAICNGENKAATSSSLNSCTKEIARYILEDDQQKTPGIKPFQINFYDTPGIESWTNQSGEMTMLKFIEEKQPVCVIYCAAPGTFADLSQVRPVLKFCQQKKIFWAFVCTNMWSSTARKVVVGEFEKELATFGAGIERSFNQSHSRVPHIVTVFGNDALCTMVNSIEYYDPDYSPERKPVQGVDELIHCVMEALSDEKLLGWCSAVLNRRTYWEKFSQKASGFVSLRIKNIQNMSGVSIQQITRNAFMYIYTMIRKP